MKKEFLLDFNHCEEYRIKVGKNIFFIYTKLGRVKVNYSISQNEIIGYELSS